MSECAGFDGKRIERRGWSHSPSPSSVFAHFFRRPAAKTRPSSNVRAATSLSLYGRIKNKARKPSHVCFFLIFGRSLSISTRTLACLHFFLFFLTRSTETAFQCVLSGGREQCAWPKTCSWFLLLRFAGMKRAPRVFSVPNEGTFQL